MHDNNYYWKRGGGVCCRLGSEASYLASQPCTWINNAPPRTKVTTKNTSLVTIISFLSCSVLIYAIQESTGTLISV